MQGKSLTYVIKFKKCKTSAPVLDSILSVKPNTVMVIKNRQIVSSDNHFTIDDPFVAGGAYEYI